jgi:hypothetical protein
MKKLFLTFILTTVLGMTIYSQQVSVLPLEYCGTYTSDHGYSYIISGKEITIKYENSYPSTCRLDNISLFNSGNSSYTKGIKIVCTITSIDDYINPALYFYEGAKVGDQFEKTWYFNEYCTKFSMLNVYNERIVYEKK